MGQGQIRVPNKGRWAHDNIKLLHWFMWLNCIATASKSNILHTVDILQNVGQCRNGDDEHKGISFAVSIIITQSLEREKDNPCRCKFGGLGSNRSAVRGLKALSVGALVY